MSWYQYQREVNQERAEGLRDPNFEATFEDWAFSGQDREADNGQVRRIAGVNLRYGECNKEHLALAKANLDRYFLLIGLTERYEDTLALANIVLGWRVRNQVVRPRTQCHEPIAPELLERLRALNRYDEELYNYAERRFDRTIKRFRIRHAKLRARLELKGKLRPSDPVLDEELQRLAAG